MSEQPSSDDRKITERQQIMFLLRALLFVLMGVILAAVVMSVVLSLFSA